MKMKSLLHNKIILMNPKKKEEDEIVCQILIQMMTKIIITKINFYLNIVMKNLCDFNFNQFYNNLNL